jgi:membrane-associated protease RseP (regulator of RpoE activity)
MTGWPESEFPNRVPRDPRDDPYAPPQSRSREPIEAEEVEDEEEPRDWQLPLLLFLATCITTYRTPDGGLVYAVAIMLTLTLHELGHFFQAVRYRVPTSFPYFIPMPLSPIGTMGAVIGMYGRHGNRRELFDIGISGPLAGLVPTLIFSVWGLYLSKVVPLDPRAIAQQHFYGVPLLFKFLISLFFGPLKPGEAINLHPMAFAGWVGLLITSLNLFPIGQLDGGHILYAMLREKAHVVGEMLLYAAIAAVILLGKWEWTLMIVILTLIGRTHPPTADDDVPLGFGRTVLGWLTLAFIPIGFTPSPFQ